MVAAMKPATAAIREMKFWAKLLPATIMVRTSSAQSAAMFMDWKAGLITDMEYSKGVGSAIEITTRSRDRDAR